MVVLIELVVLYSRLVEVVVVAGLTYSAFLFFPFLLYLYWLVVVGAGGYSKVVGVVVPLQHRLHFFGVLVSATFLDVSKCRKSELRATY